MILRMSKKHLALFLALLLLLIPASPALGYYTGMASSVVVGQPDFTSGSANQGGSAAANTLSGSYQAIVVNGKLVVSEYENNRVLIFNNIPNTNNASAAVVIGQNNFTNTSANQGGSASASTLSNPNAMATDGTKLFLCDYSNNRLLIYNRLPTSNGAAADVVVGQPDLTTVSSGTTAAKLGSCFGVGYDTGTGKLGVSDYSNSRVLIWNSAPTSNGTSADVVVGQSLFTGGTANQGGSVAANTLNFPNNIQLVDGKLLVADTANRRILVYNQTPVVNNASADVVIGQSNFTSTAAYQGGTISGSGVKFTRAPYYDGRHLFISESTPRILVFNGIPTTNGASADMVIGQSSFTGAEEGTSATRINSSNYDAGFLSTYGNQLMYADAGNSRILIFNDIISTPQLSINLPLEKKDNTTLRVRGNIQLGDRPNYAMQWVKAEVNGQGLGFVTSLGGGRDNGSNLTLYDFFHDFTPGNTVNSDMNNYTLKLVASSFNADTTSLFYFLPFNFEYVRRSSLASVSNLNFSFYVNKNQIQKVKDNIDHFEIQTSTDSGKMWKKLTTNISNEKIDITTGQIYLTIPNTLTPGIKYLVKVNSISRSSNWEQSSNYLTYFVPLRKSTTK